ncbi:Venom carboxylesterase-6 [Orchesella cincta]|uniref:Venom carboxylesterase-6 n=1 Tax=Orchesella cincta TaxID=48709 RepID=A0A1D2N9Z7_ORCCI|nr:Venom carboxylesterase-6 [Orchesella cincta]
MKFLSGLSILLCFSSVLVLHHVQAQNSTESSLLNETTTTTLPAKNITGVALEKQRADIKNKRGLGKSTHYYNYFCPFTTTTTSAPSTTTTTTTSAPSTTTTSPSTTTPSTTTSIPTTTTPSTTTSIPTMKTTAESVQKLQAAPEALTLRAKNEPLGLGPVVRISPGEVRPAVFKSRGGRKYYAFKGIPYASPTTNFQRFKEPSPVSPWDGVLNATNYGPSCIQYNILTSSVEGSEDCLTINFFTPKLQASRARKSKLFPVMVFFHQGAFMFGTSSDFEEKYMMDEDVVLVTVNYRLGAFGFLNTEGDSEALGNMGLKDQVLSLKFIREEIANFGGNPNSITIFGESAGASSVHYHLLSDLSKGLFNRAISMSGTALSPWAFTRSPRKMAKKLAAYLNCPTMDMNELFSCLQGHDARVIAEKTKDLYVWNTDPITPFAPSVEVEDSLSSFITQSPYNLMRNGRINNAAPWMLGVVEDVCLLDAWSVLLEPTLLQDLSQDWHRIAPVTFMYKETALEPDAVSNQIKAYYFGTKDVGNETASNLTNLYSDRYFNHGIRSSALMHVQTNEAIPVYLYMFSYRGTQSHTKYADISDILGVSEGDELQYLFNTNRFSETALNSTDEDISKKFVKLWVSFAKEGKPTAVWGDQEWTRVTPAQVKGDEALKYYSLNEKCGFIDEPFSARMNFWDNLPLNENNNELFGTINERGQSGEDDGFFSSFITS